MLYGLFLIAMGIASLAYAFLIIRFGLFDRLLDKYLAQSRPLFEWLGYSARWERSAFYRRTGRIANSIGSSVLGIVFLSLGIQVLLDA